MASQLDAVLATGCPLCRTFSSYRGDHPLVGTRPPPDGVAACAPRRTVLDTILVNADVATGAELRQEVTLEGGAGGQPG